MVTFRYWVPTVPKSTKIVMLAATKCQEVDFDAGDPAGERRRTQICEREDSLKCMVLRPLVKTIVPS